MANDNSNTPPDENEAAETAATSTEETSESETAAVESGDAPDLGVGDGAASEAASESVPDTFGSPWGIEKDHGGAQRLLTDGGGAEVDLDALVELDHKTGRKISILVLTVAVAIGGVWQLSIVASAEALQAKAEIRKAKEEAFLAEQMKLKKRYGILRIESVPSQAMVLKDGEKLYAGVAPPAAGTTPPAAGTTPPAAGTTPPAVGTTPPAVGATPPAAGTTPPAAGTTPPGGEPATPAGGTPAVPGAAPVDAAQAAAGPRVGMTPINMMDLDIAVPVRIKIEKAGYESYEFAVAEHLWTKDATTSEYKFFKMVELTPINCEYWFLYNAKKRREMKYENPEKGQPAGPVQKAECLHEYQKAIDEQVPVTECTCKIPPEGMMVPTE